MIIPTASYGLLLTRSPAQLKEEWENLENELFRIALGVFAKTKRKTWKETTRMERLEQKQRSNMKDKKKDASESEGNE